MKKPLLYLDNCCFNRPYDDQSQIRISLETQAKLYIQQKIKVQAYALVWSFALTAENDDNPYGERKQEIAKWAHIAQITVIPDISILQRAQELQQMYHVHGKDALHIACAIKAGCNFIVTTDDNLLKKTRELGNPVVINPIHVVELLEGTDNDENRDTDPA